MLGLPETLDAVVRAVLLTAISLTWVVLVIRVVGLRSFSKMTSFDFIVTLAVGSLLAQASTAGTWTAFLGTITAMTALFMFQLCLALLRQKRESVAELIANEPVLLFSEGSFVAGALEETRVSKSDVFAKLREANVLNLEAVRAVVLETTGDISVLHGDSLQENLLENVRRRV